MLTTIALMLASAMSMPAPTGLEHKLVDDAKDGKLDSMTLLEAALVASGVPDADVPAEAARAKRALAPAIARARTETDAHRRGDVLLRALHDTVFRAYAIGASEIDDVVHTGRYNCLSSALLYVVAADGLVDAPRAMVTKHHAYARVRVNGKDVDVETTTRGGFDADRKKLMTPDYVKKIAGADTTPEAMLDDLEHPEELPVLSLVAGVYSNRAVGLVQRGDLSAAAVALDRAQRLASGNLRARAAAWRGGVLNTGAVELVEQDRLDDARALLELALDGTTGETRALLAGNLAAVHLKLADGALAAKDWTGALAHVDTAQKLGAADKDAGPVKARADAALAALEGSDARCAQTKAKADAAECYAGLAHNTVDTDVQKALQWARRAWALDEKAPNAEGVLFVTLAKSAAKASEAGKCDVTEALVREAVPHVAVIGKQEWSGERVVGACWARRGDKAFDAKKWAEAGDDYARARAHLPAESALRENLAAVDVNHAIEVARGGDCDAARALVRRSTRADDKLAEKGLQVLESCAAVRAKKAADARDWATATAELRRGLLDAPKSAILEENLGTMLHNLASTLLNANDCAGAKALLPELELYKKKEALAAVRGACR